jgi:hypothetical protein
MATPPAALRDEAVRQALEDISRTVTCTLITYPRGEAFPRLRGMGFVHDGWTFYMSTKRDWKKAIEIAGNSKATILFNDTNRRRDHFIQIDAYATEVTGEEFDTWQEKRYVKEGEGLRRVAARMAPGDWIGWRFDPVRVRINGYISERPYQEAPAVAYRKHLGLPPLAPPIVPNLAG